MASHDTPRRRTSQRSPSDGDAGGRTGKGKGKKAPADDSSSRSGSQNPAVALAAQALAEATAALGEALRSATSDAANVENVASKFTRRSNRSDRTRADLLAAAVDLFASRGYGATSVEDVAAAAGYTKGAVYSRFPSKSDLFLGIFREHLDRAPGDPGPLDMPAQAPSSEEHLALLRESRTDPRLTLSSELATFGLRNPEHRAEAGALYARLLDESVDALLAEEGRLADEAGAPRPAGTPEERRAARERLLVLNALGVAGVDDETWLRLVRAVWPVQGPRSGAENTGGTSGDGTHGTDESR
jgi:AcrR family transcriptional regulator